MSGDRGKGIPGCLAAHSFTTPGYIFKTRRSKLCKTDIRLPSKSVTTSRNSVRLLTCAIVALQLFGLGACRGSALPDRGRIVATEGSTVPVGLEPARIVEIDGDRVFPAQRSFALAPGIHIIRVAPPVAGPPQQVPTEFGMLEYLQDEPLQLEVRSGWTYFIGLEVLERVDYTKRTGHWKAVVSRAVGPGDEAT